MMVVLKRICICVYYQRYRGNKTSFVGEINKKMHNSCYLQHRDSVVRPLECKDIPLSKPQLIHGVDVVLERHYYNVN